MDLYDVRAIEKAEAELDRFVNARARQNDEQRRVEAAWADSERRVVEKRRRANRQSWLSFHESMHKTHLKIAAEHADRRSRLMAEAGYDPDESPGPEAAYVMPP